MHGKYTLHAVGDTEFVWDLKARDAQTLLSSSLYAAKVGAETAIAACRANAPDDARYERLTEHDKRPYFVLREANGEVIGRSPAYPTDRARGMGIAACKECGPLAAIKYELAR